MVVSEPPPETPPAPAPAPVLSLPLPLHAQLLTASPVPQDASPLFAILPPELRSSIYTLALADYPDPAPDRAYDPDTCYTRPHYEAPRTSDTALLRTCRAVYAECWFLPFVLREQVHWLTAPDRAPPEYDRRARTHAALRAQLQQVQKQLGAGYNGALAQMAHLRVFAQMYKLERGALADLLRTPCLWPRRLTLTIRHADWWHWEDDEPLRFEAGWLPAVSAALPDSVGELCLELETLARKQDQLDAIAQQMRTKWFFRRTDGAVLYADATDGSPDGSPDRDNSTVSRWTGTSTWNCQRWIRDETSPGHIDYYVVRVPFWPQHVVARRGGRVSDEARRAAEASHFDAAKMRLALPPDYPRMTYLRVPYVPAPIMGVFPPVDVDHSSSGEDNDDGDDDA
ncbi:hypothetical protein SPI_03753 [Niveomyces insectorum RCEF 264]|uniref:Uncharacterized protein n=1 Tax=Niveomyces insectorum RCEF 264 TaxID=1081102 RepID=A0A162ML61_9HYPO|nr:hypothetical protein SPI_03753 [Niveomyces insectorum RCEF 264]